jgi:prepilin-type N-terminal cleavage/methylation domain-containing protein
MKSESGFSLVELMVAMTVMLLISGAAVTAILKLSTTQSTIWNRTQMHSGIRGATEVLQQEVGQAGRIALFSSAASCTVNATVPCLIDPVTVAGTASPRVSSICGMFIGENLAVDLGSSQETVTITGINGGTSDPTAVVCPTGSTITPGTITATFTNPNSVAHAVATPLQALGGFTAGVVPTTAANGSTSSVLKLFGDINADGNMVYVEYSVSPSCICSSSCNPASTTGNLYRNSMSWNTAAKTPASASQILLGNVTANPNGNACFTYQQKPVTVNGVTDTYVTDVAVTLTVQTQILDPVTKAYQTETKALLNVSPRNVFNTWELANDGYSERKQATPATITTLTAGAS